MRKHHKVLMIVITALVCISFSWYWNKTDFAQMGHATVGRLYDRNVSQVEFQRDARLLRLASQLGMEELARDLTLGAQNENEAFESFAWNLMILRHEADQLGIRPTTAEVAKVVKSLPAFAGPNGFDLSKYTDIADHLLAPNGFAEGEIEELASNQIKLQEVKKLLAAGVQLPESEMRRSYEQAYSKIDVGVVRFVSSDFVKGVEPSQSEIDSYFKQHQAELKSDEKRQVKFVAFPLTEEQKKLKGKPRIEALQKMADRANDFTDALQVKNADFDQVAQKFQLTPKETTAFTIASPPPELAAAPQAASAAFSLTKESPTSEAIQTPDGFYVLRLTNIEPSKPLTLDQAREKIVTALKEQQAQLQLTIKATDAAVKMRDELKNGKTPEQAAADAGVKLEKLPTFALVENQPGQKPTPKPKNAPPEAPDMPYIKQAVSQMNPGEVSGFTRTPTGGLLVVMEKRAPIDPRQYEAARPIIENQAVENKSQIVFFEWLRERRRAAGVEENKPQTAPS